MKTFIPHVYFSASEDTVGDLVNQIRRESEIPGTAEPKPEMKDSGKKSIIPKTVVSAPEKDTVGDPSSNCTRNLRRSRKRSPRKKQNSRKRPRAKNPSFRRRSFPLRKASLTAFMTC